MLDEDELLHPPKEPALIHVWWWFCELTDWRDSAFGIGPLSHQEMEAWARLMRVRLTPTEAHCLRLIDRGFRLREARKLNPPKPSVIEGLKQMGSEKAGNG